MEKVTRKQLLKQDDAFLSAAGEGAKWLSDHRKAVIAGVIALVVVIGGATAYIEYTGRKDAVASDLLTVGQRIMEAKVVPATEADPKADPPTFASDEDKWKAARSCFDRIVDQAGGSGVANLARLYRADLTARLGDAESAKKQLQALCDRLSPDDAVLFLAVERLAYMQEAAGDLAGAIATWGRLAGQETRFYADYGVFHQARLWAAKGDVEKARGLFVSFSQRFKESSLRDRVRDRLALLPPAPPKDAAAAVPPTKTGGK